MADWIDRVPAVVQAFYYGQEGGNALADVILGRYSPSGKLPVTMPVKWEDSPAFGRFPGDGKRLEYSEGVFVGYRWFDKRSIQPLFPFGYGLSYTTFEYSDLHLRSSGPGQVVATLSVRNTGTRGGAEAVQLYVEDVRSSVERPPKELKGIAKVFLRPGEKKPVSIALKRDAFAYYDVRTSGWVAEAGEFGIFVGSSSSDLRLKKLFRLNKQISFK
jgi:beta-glucosidase